MLCKRNPPSWQHHYLILHSYYTWFYYYPLLPTSVSQTCRWFLHCSDDSSIPSPICHTIPTPFIHTISLPLFSYHSYPNFPTRSFPCIGSSLKFPPQNWLAQHKALDLVPQWHKDFYQQKGISFPSLLPTRPQRKHAEP